MHIRHFLITGLMVGAAMFLPGQAFAEQNDSNGQQHSSKGFVQSQSSVKSDHAEKANIPVKAESAKSQEKSIVVPNNAQSNQGKSKQQAYNSIPQQAAVHKPTDLPSQAKVKVELPTKKPEVSTYTRGNGKGTAQQEKKQVVLEEQTASEKVVKKPDVNSLHKEGAVKTHIKRVNTLDSQQKSSYVSLSKKESSFETPVKEPQKQGPIPESKEEIPTISQSLSASQRTNSSGGTSNDRGNLGVGSLGMMDKWFDWNDLYDVQLVHPFHSRIAWMIHQWENAPPSPPPQKAPLLETVTRS
ncbi:hypothetical protein QE429_001062 [Bacillus sp. SORGH_AS 510]|uniref:hypothetical protein n=1 Tax=Bacillus sp. SORGH_AS_0510 TaxID=3041771 RepID=UPI0027865F8D|nr:hypothetical protein [Bacillus sp. SORGH_AS_0510]MDQ1144235.1 hypothetical protein [Bacillus sp. SORGH_AS_0510]